MPGEARILILLNPGRQSRHYLLGLAAAAARAGRFRQGLELGPIWQAASGADSASVLDQVRRQIAELTRKHRFTHVLGYVFNGTHDLGLVPGANGAPCTVWDELDLRHILLWTDHPEWAMKGCALDAPLRGWLGGDRRTHVLKSVAAAEEAGSVLGWPNVRAVAMAEDCTLVRPASGITPIHDAVAIVGDAGAPPAPTLPFLAMDDPNPADIDAAMRPHAERAWRKAVGEDHDALLAAWLDLKQVWPETSFWRLAAHLEPAHRPSLAWLEAEPRRWYGAVQALRRMVGWRRNFWLAWLGRRVNLGLYGSSAEPMGIPQSSEAAAWVGYEDQAAIYARGRVALNINAAHDEEGLTHKPFQIAASGVACVHHAVGGLDACFRPGHEVVVFRRGPELLGAVRSLGADDAHRACLASAMNRRATAEHTWENRLSQMLAPGQAVVGLAPADAA